MIITAALKDGEKCFQWIIWRKNKQKKQTASHQKIRLSV